MRVTNQVDTLGPFKMFYKQNFLQSLYLNLTVVPLTKLLEHI